MTLRAGFASAVITPPTGGEMEGYWPASDVSHGVHDDLYARAVVVDDGVTQVAIVSCDLLGVDRHLVAEARGLASQRTGIPAANILIAATHTHHGPSGLIFEPLPWLLESTARHIAGAISQAHESLRPAVLKIGTTIVDSVQQNRRHPEWPVDTTLRVLLLDDPEPVERPPIAALINFSCHATVLNRATLISADYPGYAVRTVDHLFAAGAMFLNGACGDVNPAWMVQDYAEAERVGKVVGVAAARLVGELRPLGRRHVAHNIRWDEFPEQPVRCGELIDSVRLRVASQRVELPVKDFLADEQYAACLEELEKIEAKGGLDVEERRRVASQASRFRAERAVAQRMREQNDVSLFPELMAIAFAPDVALLGLPGEFFAETAAEVRDRAGLRHLAVACYANHYVGYIVPPAAFDEGGYEPGVTWLAPEAEPIVKREALALLREVAV
jgi:hypothetical protein